MLKTLKLIALTTSLAMFCSAALAEAPPSCPGGGTPVGTIKCTGPLLNPVCTEGPPWKCVLKDNAGTKVMDGGGSGGGRRPGLFGATLGVLSMN